MAYTIIVCDDFSLYGSHKEKIIQREKLFNKLWFLIPPYLNGHDMSKCTVTMRYLLPISKEFKTETLVLSEDRYEEYLKYVLPIDTKFSKEHGDVELNLTFIMLDIDSNGNIVQRVKKTTNHILHIIPTPNWDSVIPDSALEVIDQRIIAQSAQIKALEQLANTLDNTKVDDLMYNEKSDTLQLTSKGSAIGKGVSVKDMLEDGVPIVDLNGNNSDNESDSNTDHNDGCDCGCEDNVVEFGYSDATVESTDEDNVVEF